MTALLKKTFGDYLVAKGAISDEELVTAIIAQLKALPTVLELTHSKKMLPTQAILKIIHHQQTKSCDFVTAAKELGLWSLTLEERVWGELKKTRPPLLQEIIKIRDIDPAAINKFLDSYLAEQSTASPTSAPATAAPTLVPSLAAESPISAPQEHKNPNQETASTSQNSASIQEYVNQFDEQAVELLKGSFGADVSSETLEKCAEITHRLNGCANFANLLKSKILLTSLEKILRQPQTVKSSKETGNDGITVLLQLRDYIIKNGSEDGIDSNETQLSLMHEACVDLINRAIKKG